LEVLGRVDQRELRALLPAELPGQRILRVELRAFRDDRIARRTRERALDRACDLRPSGEGRVRDLLPDARDLLRRAAREDQRRVTRLLALAQGPGELASERGHARQVDHDRRGRVVLGRAQRRPSVDLVLDAQAGGAQLARALAALGLLPVDELDARQALPT